MLLRRGLVLYVVLCHIICVCLLYVLVNADMWYV
jgi:hypothetical protein